MEKRENVKSFFGKFILLFLVFFAVIVMLWIAFERVEKQYSHLVVTDTSFQLATADITQLNKTSNDLTAWSREFVSEGDLEKMVNYAKEITEDKNREHAEEGMVSLMKTRSPRACELITDALKYSNDLAEYEIHAMKLAAVAYHTPESDIPQLIAAYELTNEEKKYSKEEALQKAYDMVYGKDYCDLKNQITESTENVEKVILLLTQNDQSGTVAELELRLYVTRMVLHVLSTMFVILLLFAVWHEIKTRKNAKESK